MNSNAGLKLLADYDHDPNSDFNSSIENLIDSDSDSSASV